MTMQPCAILLWANQLRGPDAVFSSRFVYDRGKEKQGGMPMRRFHPVLAATILAVLPLTALRAQSASPQGDVLPLTVELGDVSLTKLPFVMAAETGIYRRNGL